jgi:hypothetical protein
MQDGRDVARVLATPDVRNRLIDLEVDIVALPREGNFFGERVREHLLRRDALVHESGGFELLSATHYFDDIDRRQVRQSVTKTRPDVLAK